MTKIKYRNEELIKLAQNGDTEAEEKLLVDNTRLCYSIAKKYSNTGIEIDDLASIGKIGLIKAYKKFDLSKNIKFATFAATCINNEILMYLRTNKKHKSNISLETTLSIDVDGKELTLIDIIPAPEDRFKTEDIEELNHILEIFDKGAKERDKIILRECIMKNRNQREVAKEFNISQSYVSRIVKGIEKKLRYIGETNRYGKNNKKEIDSMNMKKKRKYSKNDYVYVLTNYPNLTNKEIANLMGVAPQNICRHRGLLEDGHYKDLAITETSKELIEKINKYVMYAKTEKVKKTAQEISDDLAIDMYRMEEIATIEIEDNNKKEEISNEEIIILNNQVSIMSNKEEISSLIFGIYKLLDSTPKDSKIKLDLKFEVVK